MPTIRHKAIYILEPYQQLFPCTCFKYSGHSHHYQLQNISYAFQCRHIIPNILTRVFLLSILEENSLASMRRYLQFHILNQTFKRKAYGKITCSFTLSLNSHILAPTPNILRAFDRRSKRYYKKSQMLSKCSDYCGPCLASLWWKKGKINCFEKNYGL